LHIKEIVGSTWKGSIKAVSKSGMRERSPHSIVLSPGKFDPSNPTPSESRLLPALDAGTVIWCHLPRKSVNFRSMCLIPFSLIIALSSSIVEMIALPPFD